MGISEIIGKAVLCGSGAKIAAYRALRPIPCAGCAAVIDTGTHFTRHRLNEGGMHISPRCAECVPFTLVPVEPPARSTLMHTLMTPQPSSSAPAPEKGTREELANAVERRLGPALTRSQHPRRKG
ncbi:MAG: hypothetical protein M3458_13530 [Acidobacteriota bacterium]|nr:hypothetical protein [Acidobacteriota bacterium]